MDVMTDKPAVAVLMSTYNGEQYISGQVESIFKQRDVTIHLYIRDDGSSDRTCDMLKRLEAGREDVCFDRSEKNLGPGMSFMKLLYDVVREGPEYAYYAFSDQDDIWLPDKLKIAVGALVKERRPALYCSNQILYENGKPGRLRFHDHPDLSLKGHITRNTISGCTMVMNRQLALELTRDHCPGHEILDYRMHDAWIFLAALLCGTIRYDRNSYIYYRIHENNTVGLKKDALSGRIKRVLGHCPGKARYRNLRMRTARALLARFPDAREEDIRLLKEFAEYQQGIKNKIRLIRDKEIYRKSGEGFWVFAFKALVNYI